MRDDRIGPSSRLLEGDGSRGIRRPRGPSGFRAMRPRTDQLPSATHVPGPASHGAPWNGSFLTYVLCGGSLGHRCMHSPEPRRARCSTHQAPFPRPISTVGFHGRAFCRSNHTLSALRVATAVILIPTSYYTLSLPLPPYQSLFQFIHPSRSSHPSSESR
ncbi:uncharacterized protein SCHCODRAFT_02094451 [Schizophyllum commune H4-8]|uniref:uncharacterized protein n=1 Tax=Schizophyllum commune (strain H4-8 / FGSC 9210) TaxID=578458 RepID=UPI00215E69CD|nr:uncharacterized protein SCHCODRAFT_02094451 [Schizophyllum commune H4-8]KAI5886288.1 hypothetical protein SCHCODRAFT_02094451 [Schizophyllum commune H4-8]